MLDIFTSSALSNLVVLGIAGAAVLAVEVMFAQIPHRRTSQTGMAKTETVR